MEHVDVLIVGAGLSGIGTAWHVKHRSPGRTYAIWEARGAIGGTWDLFRYPGIRSDSDMHTLGYRFKPWTEAKAIADGPSILKYVRDTAHDEGIDQHIAFHTRVTHAAWDSGTARWTVTATRDGAEVGITSNFLVMSTGYYSYDEGHLPTWGGEEEFAGKFVHPQFWPEDLDYSGKRVVVIGSGATAMTLVPKMAETAAKVTMLQRSPTYVVSRPAEDKLANRMRKLFGPKASYTLTRWRNVGWQLFFYNLTRRKPQQVKDRLIGFVRDALGPDYDIAKHFTPTYNPWDQRLCLIPDDDLYTAIRSGKADVVTDTIEKFVPEGIKLSSGETIPADIVVTATGLKLNVLGDATLSMDGEPIELGKRIIYRGMMLGGVPNLSFVFGYTNASWTLKADLTSEFVCRLLNRMTSTGTSIATPVVAGNISPEPFLDFSSGYVQRALDKLPKQGDRVPWKLYQNYAKDAMTLRYGKLDDGVMRFSNPARERAAA
jgi:cation diffusion facilitator CzcD-associated flavoprotein CzcO